jgi:hypothetical protein
MTHRVLSELRSFCALKTNPVLPTEKQIERYPIWETNRMLLQIKC